MGVDDYSTFGDSFEEVEFVEGSLCGKVKEPHIFEEEGVHAGFGVGFKLHFL
ncbi:MAG: hypothetical protein KDD45_07050 [Bdellovibrionales bacterium]|nr:hypothetical protein [Bdellovibrionales bacterium]